MAEIFANTDHDDKIYGRNTEKTTKSEIKHIIKKLHEKLKLPDDLKHDILIRTKKIVKIINKECSFNNTRNLVPIITFIKMKQRGMDITEEDVARVAGIKPRIIYSFMLQMRQYIRFK